MTKEISQEKATIKPKELQVLNEYNGWTNKPTWLVKLWIDNDYNIYLESKNHCATEDELREWIENEILSMPHHGAGMGYDLLNWSLSYVNWSEIIQAIKED